MLWLGRRPAAAADATPRLGASIRTGAALKKRKKEKKKDLLIEENRLSGSVVFRMVQKMKI